MIELDGQTTTVGLIIKMRKINAMKSLISFEKWLPAMESPRYMYTPSLS